MKKHYTNNKILTYPHLLKVHVVGCGGTGTEVLRELARVHFALIERGFSGFQVIAWDDKNVAEHNLVRQRYLKRDLGKNKAEVNISKLNRAYGLNWIANPYKFQTKRSKHIVISCVDNVRTRLMIAETHKDRNEWNDFYWLDFGNEKDCGQFVLGGFGLPNVIELFPNMIDHEDVTEPSCSSLDALNKQNLYINSTLVQFGMQTLYKLFKTPCTEIHGAFLNLDNLTTNPIYYENSIKKVKPETNPERVL